MADGSALGADPGAGTDLGPGEDPGPPDDEGLSAGDTWIELSVRADLEAVEAVSEILSRFAPGGTSVEPGFELVDEGLGARVDPNRPAIVRAYLPGREPERGSSRRPGGAPGARPSPGVRPAPDRRARGLGGPRGRLGPCLEGPLPGPADRPAAGDPADLAAPPAAARRRGPGARSGNGLRDGAASNDAAVPGRDRGLVRRRPRWPVPASSMSAAARGS